MLTRRSLGLGISAGLMASGGALAAGGTIDRITFASGNDVIGLSGIDAWIATPDISLMLHITDSLLDRSPNGEIGPSLATEWRLVDPVTWEFKIRQGITFHNGEPLTAHCFKAFYDLVSNPENNSILRATHMHVQEAQVPDDYTLRVITKQPTPAAFTAFVNVFAVPAEFIKTNGVAAYRRRPIGTGAYRFVERIPDQRITLSANDRYWGGPQRVRTIVYRPIREAASRVAALLTGEIDLALDLPPEMRPMLASGRGLRVKSGRTNRVMMLTLNYERQEYPTANVKVREAINYAIDREALCRDVLGGGGTPVAFMPPSTLYADPSNEPVKRDIVRAKALLAEAGFPDGLSLDFNTPNGRYLKDKEVAEAIAGQLAEAGIRANVRPQEWGNLQRLNMSGNGTPISLIAWGFNGDVHNFNVNNLRSGMAQRTGSTPEMDALCDMIAIEMDPVKRKALVFEQQAMMKKLWPKAFLMALSQVGGVNDKGDLWVPRSDEMVRLYQNAVLS